MNDWRLNLSTLDAQRLQQAIDERKPKTVPLGEQIERAVAACGRTKYHWLIIRPLGCDPLLAPGVAIGDRGPLGLQRAIENAELFYPHASGWEIAGSDLRDSNAEHHPEIKPGEIALHKPSTVAIIGFG